MLHPTCPELAGIKVGLTKKKSQPSVVNWKNAARIAGCVSHILLLVTVLKPAHRMWASGDTHVLTPSQQCLSMFLYQVKVVVGVDFQVMAFQLF